MAPGNLNACVNFLYDKESNIARVCKTETARKCWMGFLMHEYRGGKNLERQNVSIKNLIQWIKLRHWNAGTHVSKHKILNANKWQNAKNCRTSLYAWLPHSCAVTAAFYIFLNSPSLSHSLSHIHIYTHVRKTHTHTHICIWILNLVGELCICRRLVLPVAYEGSCRDWRQFEVICNPWDNLIVVESSLVWLECMLVTSGAVLCHTNECSMKGQGVEIVLHSVQVHGQARGLGSILVYRLAALLSSVYLSSLHAEGKRSHQIKLRK